jgi:plastocyanin
MDRRMLSLVVVGLMLALAVTAGCSSTSSTTPTTPTTPKTTPTSPSGTSEKTVSIIDFAFQPTTMTVKPGTTVKWTNNGATAHTVTFADFASSQLQPGQTFSHTFDTEGSFPYHCSIHPTQMNGTIVVSATASSGGTTTTPSTSTTPSTTTTPVPGY